MARKRESQKNGRIPAQVLHQRSRFLNSVLDSLPYPFYVVDADDYSIVMANAATGLTVGSPKPKCYQATHRRSTPCCEAECACPIDEVKRTGKPTIVEHIHYDANGNQRNVEVHGYPVFDDQGHLVQMIECCLDITERTRAEQALQEANERLQAQAQELEVAAEGLHAQAEELKAANEMLAREVAFRERAERNLLERTERIINHQTALLRLAKGAGSDLAVMMERAAAEAAKTLAAERVSIWLCNDRATQLVCRELYTLSGGSGGAGASLTAADCPAYFKAIEKNRILATSDVRTDPHRQCFARDYLEPLSITSMMDVSIRLHGRLLGVICCEHVGPEREWSLEEQDFGASVADVVALQIETSERRELEEVLAKTNVHLADTVRDLQRSNKELQEFAYAAAHDLKAPLRAIGTLADWIVSDYADKFDEPGKQQMRLLKGRVTRMAELIDGILQYSEIGRVANRPQPVDLNNLIPEIITLLNPPQHVQVVVEGRLPSLVIEKIQLGQVFRNLIDNAITYLDKPEGRVTIGCIEDGDSWRFSVSDNGPGIDEKYFQKIFQMFQTLVPRDERESTGIGLAVVKKIVELYGGGAWVESEVGQGTTFFFTVPKQGAAGSLCSSSTSGASMPPTTSVRSSTPSSSTNG